MFNHRRVTPEQAASGAVTLEDVTKAVLWSIQEMYDEHLTFPSPEARDAAVLWVAHTWVVDALDVTPRLSVRSMEPGSGKSVVIEVASHMTPNSVNGVNMTPAVLWRLMPTRPTMFIDEVDTVFGKNGSGSSHVVLRGILNAGYRRGAYVLRTSGPEGIVRFPVFGAVAMAGLGRLPDTIATRSIEIEMRRRKAGDPPVKPFRLKFAEPALKVIRDRAAAWSKPAIEALRYAMPEMPKGVMNRAAEIWEGVIAIGDLAGAEWGERARKACVALTAESAGKPTSLGTQLLIDIRTVIAGKDRITSADLVTALLQLPDGVWTADNLDEVKVSRLLAEYGVRPKAMKIGAATRRGYLSTMFDDVLARYVPSKTAELMEVGA